MLFLENIKVSLKLLFEQALVVGIGYLGILTIVLIHLVSNFQRCRVCFAEYGIRVTYEVIEIVGCAHHIDRDVVVIELGVFEVNITAVTGNTAKLKWDFLHSFVVLLSAQLLSSWLYVNQAAKNARPRVGNLYGFICAHKEKSLESICVCRFELLVHGHKLVRNKAVQTGVIFDTRQVTVVLNGNQRIGFECFQSEGIVGTAEGLCIEYRVIAFEQQLNNVKDCRFSTSGRAIQNHELLKLFGIAGYDRADSPLDFMALLGRI